MNLRPRHREDPEINLISMIDVLLVLLIFFMASTTFNQEGRVKVQLPQASETPLPRGSHEPLVITVTAEGGYRVNERSLINASPDTLRAALVKEAGSTAVRSPYARMRVPPIRPSSPPWMSRANWGSRSSTSRPCTRKPRLERGGRCGRGTWRRFLGDLSAAAQIRETLPRRISDRRAGGDPVCRLERLVGLSGEEVPQRRLHREEPGGLVGGAHRRRGVVHAAGHRRLRAVLLSELGRPAGHQGPEAGRLLPLSAPADGVLGPAAVRASAFQADQ